MSRRAVLLFVGFLCAGTAAAAPPVVAIPGPIRSIPAPNAAGGRIFYRPHVSPDGGQASPVFYDDGRGRVRQVATISRSMGVGWSPDGRRLFLQDNWGSDVADCSVLTRTPRGIAKVSLTKLIERTPGHPTRTEQRGHYYVHCDRWRSPGQIIGAVSGHTDTNPSRGFDYPFIYDARTHRILWRSR